MSMKKLTPNVMVDDMDGTLAFYTDVLGFAVLATVPEHAPYNWAMLGKDDVTLMAQTRTSLGGELPALQNATLGASMTFYTDVADLQAWYDRLKSKVEIVQDWHTTFYNTQEFAFRDPNGYIWALSEPLPTT